MYLELMRTYCDQQSEESSLESYLLEVKSLALTLQHIDWPLLRTCAGDGNHTAVAAIRREDRAKNT